ncbi:hypothetical protein [Streptomyces sp. AC555_RSS877]|uniref:hypothetical protein n=1 Tax=Streptomyces sp. AC555_RSS877 TaxID=2823688 RepID=UPI001C253192|nr:hypothetical protein [Streptomyces sp. AC555_RSS877]
MSLPLVAHDRDGEVVGALLAVPSGTVVSTVTWLPGHEQQALLSMLKYEKERLRSARTPAAAGSGPPC